MILHKPFYFSSRLLPALQAGGAEIQLEYSERPGREGRTRYRWTIDLPDGSTYSDDDLQSGCQGGSLQEGFRSLLDFLCAAAESYSYHAWDREAARMFPKPVVEWAHQFSNELEMLTLELTDNNKLIEE